CRGGSAGIGRSTRCSWPGPEGAPQHSAGFQRFFRTGPARRPSLCEPVRSLPDCHRVGNGPMPIERKVFMQRKSSWLPVAPYPVLAVLVVAPIAADDDLGNWSNPVNLGPIINSPFSDDGPALSR